MDLSPDELRALIARGEGRHLEFKRGLPRDAKTARTLCAFANTKGGILLVGVTDDRRICGVSGPRSVVERLHDIARDLVSPPVDVELTTIVDSEGPVVLCSVPLSPARPHAILDGGEEPQVVVRVGSSNRRASGATLAALRRPREPESRRDPLERKVLEWVEGRAGHSGDPGGAATVEAFASARNIGRQRARRAFLNLERDGLLVAHGVGARRFYRRP